MKVLTTEQGEKLREIGTYLRRLRKEQSISLEEVAANTYIRVSLLKALEEAQEESLPEAVYIQGFIRRYADFLDLDGNALAMTFPIELPPIDLSEQLLDSEVIGGKKYDVNNDSESFKEESASLLKQFSLPSLPEQFSLSNIPYLPYILAGTVVFLGSIFYLVTRPHTSPSVVQNQRSSTVEPKKVKNTATPTTPKSNPDSPTSSTPSPTPVQPVTATPNTTPATTFQVAAQFQDDCWVRVTVDGKVEFEGTLTKGTQKSWNAKEKIVFRAGNAGVVLVSLNNQEAKPLGEVGKVAEVTLTPQQ
ncbi:helix-turn-helix domain-containing protein [Floridanema evergladense]|uniref:Helix-turn-helix domain-containing protein n=1 Tax=Floridaenema evergladense BLCC-F167 TaxID=3153639 RepID=A0ABV4WEK7_9CYAN